VSKLVLLSLSLAACATTGTALPGESAAPRTGVRLDLTAHTDDASSAFPDAVDTRVRSIDRMAHAIKARYGVTTMTATLDLCVAPDGHVTKVALAEKSSYDAFDHALVRDAAAWQFASLPGPASVESCRRATVEYATH
jgi:outer membrane biosynthesis protein TonB